MSESKNVNLTANQGQIKVTGSTPALTIGMNEITDAIDKSIELPQGVKEPIKDFITESFNELWNTVEELMTVSPPLELADNWEIVLQIIQSFM